MTEKELTDEETELSISAMDAHNLMEMCNTNGWKIIKEMFFERRMEECKDYIRDSKNTDITILRAKLFQYEFIQSMLDDIGLTIKIGLEREEELVKRKEKKKKK